MILKDAINKIKKYLDGDSSTPIIVDVPSLSIYKSIENHFKVGSNEFISAKNFCTAKDTLPQRDKLLETLSKKKTKVFLTEYSTFLKLKGENRLRIALQAMLDLKIKGKLVIITFKCGKYLNFEDPRLQASGRVNLVEAESTDDTIPSVHFVSPDLPENCVGATYPGIENLPNIIEKEDAITNYIRTKWVKNNFPLSLLDIQQYSSAYDIIAKANPELSSIGSDAGSDEQWRWLMSVIGTSGGWAEFVNNEFGNKDNLSLSIGKVNSFNDNKKWAYFIALRVNGAPHAQYLSTVIQKSETFNQFQERLYTNILEIETSDRRFVELYQERKELLRQLEFPVGVISTFCKKVEAKGSKGLFYLTDLSMQEKELVFTLIAKYAKDYSKQRLYQIIATVYPDLHSYLTSFEYGNVELDEYFSEYKYCKVTNTITSEMEALVGQYATNRIYYKLLERRSLVLSQKETNGAKLYFVDALGVEFLRFIQDLCYSRGLSFDASLAYCELPSITSMNKEFLETFPICTSIKSLDDTKHEGTEGFDYQQTKLPIHLIKELEILQHVITNVEKDLNGGTVDKVFIISDHGASRLAVIKESENKWEVKEKGQHSGRCCPISDIDEKPDFAVEENGFWCLANYDRFKGGRKASVEVHGGASLEEVIVSIIEITLAGDTPKCEIMPEYQTIKVSFKQKAKIKLFIAKELDNVRISLNGKFYIANPSEEKYVYDVDMPDVKRGKYSIDVYSGNSRIAAGLTFEAKSAGATENKFF